MHQHHQVFLTASFSGYFAMFDLGFPPPKFQYEPSQQQSIIPFVFYRYIVGQYVTIHDDVISHINISQVASLDGGAYSCSASNSVGSVSHTARLNVYGKSCTCSYE